MTFNINFDSKDETRSTVHNVGRALLKKKTLMLGSKEIDTINKLAQINVLAQIKKIFFRAAHGWGRAKRFPI